MVSFRTTLLALAGAVAVSADYYIDPDSVPLSMRQAWCRNELSSCPLICKQVEPGTTMTNTCDPETLTYGCVCGNGLAPNVSEYSLTIPFHVCQEFGSQCVTACGMDNECANACRVDHPCGAQSPTKVTTTQTTSMPKTSGAAEPTDGVYDGFGDGTPGAQNQKGSNAVQALQLGNAYGIMVVAAGLFAGFAVVL